MALPLSQKIRDLSVETVNDQMLHVHRSYRRLKQHSDYLKKYFLSKKLS